MTPDFCGYRNLRGGYIADLAMVVVAPTKNRDGANDAPACAELVAVVGVCVLCGHRCPLSLFDSARIVPFFVDLVHYIPPNSQGKDGLGHLLV